MGVWGRYTTRWALNAARPRRRIGQMTQWRDAQRGVVGTFYGFAVTRAARTLPYGVSSRTLRTHLVRDLWIAWRAGRPVDGRVQWWCGGDSYAPSFRLTASRTQAAVCELCLLNRDRWGQS
jgi:hypothetical protein